MSKRGGSGGSSPPTKKRKDKSGEVVSCIKCNKSADNDGVECECCYKWEHRECAGISEDEYAILNDASPNIMFFCSFCRPKVALALKFFNDIEQKQKSLDSKITQLEQKLNLLVSSATNLTAEPVQISEPSVNFESVAPQQNVNSNKTPRPKPSPAVPDKRYNVVIYGINESPKDTARSERQKHDLNKLLNILSDIDSSLTGASVRDFHRLGKFKPSNTRPRPLLVKLLRTFEASLILSKKDSLTSSTISIKRDLSPEERAIENALLKERRSLIDSGIERRHIKIRGISLYVKNKLHGSVQDSTFKTAPSPTNPSSSDSMDSSEERPSADTNPSNNDTESAQA